MMKTINWPQYRRLSRSMEAIRARQILASALCARAASSSRIASRPSQHEGMGLRVGPFGAFSSSWPLRAGTARGPIQSLMQPWLCAVLILTAGLGHAQSNLVLCAGGTTLEVDRQSGAILRIQEKSSGITLAAAPNLAENFRLTLQKPDR